MKNKQKSTVTKKNEFLGTPTIQHDTYIYRFADGTSSTLVFGPADVAGLGSRWLAELQELFSVHLKDMNVPWHLLIISF